MRCAASKILLAPAGASIHVHDHDVVRRERRDENLIDIGLEPLAVDRPVENHRRRHAVAAQTADEGRRLPMSVRNARAQPLAFLFAPAFARHVGRGPGLIDEDEPFRIEIELALEPGLAPRLYVRAVLFARMGGLFLNVRPQRSRNVHNVARLAFTPRSASSRSRSSLIVKSGVASINPSK